MLFQVLCGFEPIFYTTHPNEESIKMNDVKKREKLLWDCYMQYFQFLSR